MGRTSESGYRVTKDYRDSPTTYVYYKEQRIGEVYIDVDAKWYSAKYFPDGTEHMAWSQTENPPAHTLSKSGALWIKRRHQKQSGFFYGGKPPIEKPKQKPKDRYEGPPKHWQNGITERNGKLYFYGCDIDAKADEYDLPSWWWTPRAEWTFASMISHWIMMRQVEYMKKGATLQKAIQLEQQDRRDNYADVDITEIIKKEYGDSIV